MNPETVDNEYAKVQQSAQQVAQVIQDLATKLQAAAGAGDANAREWLLDLKSVALQVQSEQLSVQGMLQAVHDFTVDHLSQQQPAYGAPQYAPQPYYQQVPAGGGGILSRFMGGGFGRAIATGAGFAIGDDVINDIF